jgi:hypothetical protein
VFIYTIYNEKHKYQAKPPPDRVGRVGFIWKNQIWIAPIHGFPMMPKSSLSGKN